MINAIDIILCHYIFMQVHIEQVLKIAKYDTLCFILKQVKKLQKTYVSPS